MNLTVQSNKNSRTTAYSKNQSNKYATNSGNLNKISFNGEDDAVYTEFQYSENSSGSNKISFKSEGDAFYTEIFQEKLKNMNWFKKKIFLGTTKARQEVTEMRLNKKESDLNAKRNELNLREDKLNAKENDLIIKDKQLKEKNNQLNSREEKLNEKDNKLNMKNNELVSREGRIVENEKNIKQKENELSQESLRLRQKNTVLSNQEKELFAKEIRLNKQDESLRSKDSILKTKENNLRIEENELAAKEEKIIEREKAIQPMEEALKAKEDELTLRELNITDQENALKIKEDNLKIKGAEAKQIKAEGIQMKQDALQIRTDSIKTKREAIKLKEEAIGIEDDSFYGRFSSSRKSEEATKTLKEKEALFDQYIAEAQSKKDPDEKIKKELEALKSQLNKAKSDHNIEIENLKKTNASIIEGLRAQVTTLKAQQTTEKSIHNVEITKLKLQQNQERATHSAELENLKKTHNDIIKNLKQEINDSKLQLDKERLAHNIEIENLKKVKNTIVEKEITTPKTSYNEPTILNIKATTTKKIQDIVNSNFKKNTEQGWSRIGGYEDLKQALEGSFINKLALEQRGEQITLPNGILFYGPPNTGKTTFAKAFAEQSGCNVVEINMSQSQFNLLDDILSEAKKSKELYKTSKNQKRTILLLDNFDAISDIPYPDKTSLENNQNMISELKKHLGKCSEEFKCTLLMTTNYPQKNNSELLTQEFTPFKIFLGPTNKENTAEIFKFYLKDFADQSINYTKLSGEVIKARESGKAFSSGRISNIVKNCLDSAMNSRMKLYEDDLIHQIKTVGPDVFAVHMEKFGRDIYGKAKIIL